MSVPAINFTSDPASHASAPKKQFFSIHEFENTESPPLSKIVDTMLKMQAI
jgi:hypothetical protein